jgi:hypothetical protein
MSSAGRPISWPAQFNRLADRKIAGAADDGIAPVP